MFNYALNWQQIYGQWMHSVNLLASHVTLAKGCMHPGTVCQLNYHGGGWVQYTFEGKSWCIHFQQPAFLPIGASGFKR